jgi:hypothetical protein
MLPVPESLAALLSAFAIVFTRPTFEHAQVLVTGVLLTAGRRTVSAAMRTIGLGGERHFTTYHRVLNRAVWSPLRLSRILLQLLVTTFLTPGAPLVLLIDGTLERRWGPKIALKGRYHDAVRSQSGHVVTTEGIHWVCLALLVPSPWGRREWALPILTVPTRSPALSQQLGKPHRTIPDYAQVLVRLVHRWYPTRELLLVGDSAFAAARLGHTCREHGARLVSRLVLNAQLYDPVPPQPKGKPGVKPKKGPRQAKLCDRLIDAATVWQTEDLPWYAGQTLTMDLTSGTALWHRDGEAPLPIRWVLLRDPSGKRRPCALFCTDPAATLHQIIAWYVSRWQIEVTFEEVRCYLGVETQRQWSMRALARTTPCLLGLFSIVLLLASRLAPSGLPIRQAAWYAKTAPTFADAFAVVRRQLWAEVNSPAAHQTRPLGNPSSLVLELLLETACYAA